MHTRGGTVRLFHGSDHGFRVTVSVWFGKFREKTILSNKNKENKNNLCNYKQQHKIQIK